MYINYLKDLLRFESLTPRSNGAIEYVEKVLKQAGFKTEIKIFGDSKEQVTNLYAVYGSSKPNICFVGHVDVVPSGDRKLWHNHDPFTAHIENEKIYGRGVVDMKGAIACFLAASLDFIKNKDDLKGSISFLLTSDEEGEAKHGTEEMLQYIYDQGHKIDFAIVGEPTCEEEIGDTIKIGRRGSVNFRLNIDGLSGHVAYPDKANNPLPCLVEILNELINTKLDEGTEFFQNSNLEVTNIDVGNNISNVIPAYATAYFNIRFNNLHNAETLSHIIEAVVKRYCKKYKTSYQLEYSSSSDSFIQDVNENIRGFAEVVEQTLKIKPQFSTSGGTSDARFVKNYCSLVEFGLLSETAHKINEYTKISDLQKLYDVYYNFLMEIL
ncbi:MAG TPA: succinyl-diaminopimelate desuccinylase [Rickettsia endosymbiont of Pyrocoelia pectoralis]|nr:succinyl-diaminopimelate desuccinylase [Rickettsia endosymbiont of Pyrocoelia pectoralis]